MGHPRNWKCLEREERESLTSLLKGFGDLRQHYASNFELYHEVIHSEMRHYKREYDYDPTARDVVITGVNYLSFKDDKLKLLVGRVDSAEGGLVERLLTLIRGDSLDKKVGFLFLGGVVEYLQVGT